MAKISNVQIRRAITEFAARGCTLRQWSDVAVNRALDRAQDSAGNPALAKLYRAIDQAAYAMRWAEFTGRYNCALVFESRFTERRAMIEAMVRLYFRGAASPELQKDAYVAFCELAKQHAAERAAEMAA